MKTPRVVILTEISRLSGQRRLARAHALAQACTAEGLNVKIVVQAGRGDEVKLTGTTQVKVGAWFAFPEAVRRFVTGATHVFVDSCSAPLTVYRSLVEDGLTCVFFDEGRRLEYPGPAIVINTEPAAFDLFRSAPQKVTCLLGVSYTPLRRPFRSPTQYRVRDRLKKVVVAFGGYDVGGCTSAVLKVLTRQFPELSPTAILGHGAMPHQSLALFEELGVQFLEMPAAPRLVRELASADLAICTAGHTLTEALVIGIPSIAIAVTNRQLDAAQRLHQAGVIDFGGWWEDDSVFSGVVESIERLAGVNLRRERSMLARGWLDGKGAHRIVRFALHGKM